MFDETYQIWFNRSIKCMKKHVLTDIVKLSSYHNSVFYMYIIHVYSEMYYIQIKQCTLTLVTFKSWMILVALIY